MQCNRLKLMLDQCRVKEVVQCGGAVIHIMDIGSVWCFVLGSQQWFVLKNLNAASSVYYMKLRAVTGGGAGTASDVIAVSTVVTGSHLLLSLVCHFVTILAHLRLTLNPFNASCSKLLLFSAILV